MPGGLVDRMVRAYITGNKSVLASFCASMECHCASPPDLGAVVASE